MYTSEKYVPTVCLWCLTEEEKENLSEAQKFRFMMVDISETEEEEEQE